MTNLNTIKTKINITDFRDCRICSFFYNEDRVQHNPSILKRELKTLRGVDMRLQLTLLSFSIATRSNFVQNLFNVLLSYTVFGLVHSKHREETRTASLFSRILREMEGNERIHFSFVIFIFQHSYMRGFEKKQLCSSLEQVVSKQGTYFYSSLSLSLWRLNPFLCTS